ncbi:ferredoxin--NADP reductase [Marinicauda algicola]|uniref:ferredoxin--NADP(+) reductase n=1 Tax=Marinicauda algicola TaxID=2029849 RepID=A0A4S2GXM7_9PROT|nr:ferredoxin--NADP reductase [Marinicauda algicola]TGY87611.1 ferredoxin--NADP reductase [Marinicauda algicola]
MNHVAANPEGAPTPYIAEKGAFFEVEVLSVKHYTETLFAFRTARPQSFRFRAGEFVMIGLEGEKKPVLRAYSIASPTWDEELEFYSIKVPGGQLTSRLKDIRPGDRVLLGKKPTGTLVADALRPGRRLYLFSTGTGIAPFASLIREPDVYERFEEVVLTHTCRTQAELAYGEELVDAVRVDPLVGEFAAGRLVYFNSVTREDGPRVGRITDLIENGRLFEMIGREPLDPARDRAMVCGSFAVLTDVKTLLETRGFEEGSNARPGDFVVEKAFSGEGI